MKVYYVIYSLYSILLLISQFIIFKLYLNPVLPDGSITYSEIKTFSHKKHTTVSMFKSIETYGNSSIHLSGMPYIYLRRNWEENFKSICMYTENSKGCSLVRG